MSLGEGDDGLIGERIVVSVFSTPFLHSIIVKVQVFESKTNKLWHPLFENSQVSQSFTSI